MLFVASMSIFFVYSIIGNFVMLILVGKKYSVQKWRFFATFLILTFELFVGVVNLTKNRSCGRFCKSWLCSVCSSRAELLKIGQEIEFFKDKLGLSILS